MASSSQLSSSPIDEEQQRKVPRWIPVSLLAVTTAALAVPAILLWRQKRSLALPSSSRTLQRDGSHLPVRRRVLSGGVTPSRPAQTPSQTSQSLLPRRTRASVKADGTSSKTQEMISSAPMISAGAKKATSSSSLFDGPLLSLGAFGLATATVGVGAVLGVWGVQRAMDVRNVDEFATRVRQLLLAYLPDLSRRIYRVPKSDDGPLPAISSESSSNHSASWSWDEAENRLSSAYDKGGIGGWAVSAMKELEEEERIERRKRGL